MATDLGFDTFLQGAAAANYLAVDTEANGQDVRDGRGFAMGVSLAYSHPVLGAHSLYLPFRHQHDNRDSADLSKLKAVLEAHTCLIFHNAKFDLVSLRTLGIDIRGKWYDTMLMAHMINENWLSKGLDYLGKILLKSGKKGEAVEQWTKFWGWHSLPVAIATPYAEHDAVLTLGLFNYFWPTWVAEDLDKLWPVEMQWTELLIYMEGNGVRINKELCKRQASAGRMRMAELVDEIGYNPGSPKQLGELFNDVLKLPVVKWTQLDKDGNPTAGSRASFDKDAMAEYDFLLESSDSPLARLVLEYRGWQKAVTSSYEPYVSLCSPDGRLRPNYKIHGTVTGRLSCEKPNLQQIPRVSDKDWNGQMKAAFIPKDGYVLLEADYSQLELRLGTAYADERMLKQVFDEGRDIFTEMSQQLGMKRQDVKTMVYSIQYGAGLKRLSNVFKISAEEADQRRQAYYDAYPGFKIKSDIAARKAKSNGYLRLWTGRRRHFANPAAESHKAFNSVVQGGAAEIVKHTGLRLFRDVVVHGECDMLLQVHDSYVFEVRADLVEKYRPLIQDCMEAIPEKFGVKFAVEVKEWGK